MHSFEGKLSALSNGLSCKVVQRIDRELFDLKARGDIFFNHPVGLYNENGPFLLLLDCFSAIAIVV